MNLHWLNSGIWWLLPLVGLPILAHLIRRPPSQRWAFGSMYLLSRVQHKVTKRNRLHDWLLLLLRIALLCMLGLAILRPEIRWTVPNEQQEYARNVVLLVDTSLSMGQTLTEQTEQTALEWAKRDIQGILKEDIGERQFQLLTFDASVDVVLDDWNSDATVVSASLSSIQQSEKSGRLAPGLQKARQLLDGQGGEIWLYSDQSGHVADGIEDEIALLVQQNVALIPKDIPIESPSNMVITSAQYSTGLEGGTLRFVLQHYGTQSQEVRCMVTLPDGSSINTFVQTLPNGEVESFVTLPRVTDGGIGQIEVMDERLTLDNLYHFHLPKIGASRVLLVDGDPGSAAIDSEVYYLERALTPSSVGAGIVPEILSDLSAQEPSVETHAVIFLANVPNPASNIGALTEFVRSGGGVFIALGGNTDIERVNQLWKHLLPSAIKDRKTLASDLALGIPTALPDLTHPLFQPFARGGLNGFPNTKWLEIFRLEDTVPEENVLLALENGLPLLVEQKVGKGRVCILLSMIDMAGGNFPLQSIYMPLMQKMTTYLGGSASGGMRLSHIVGETVNVMTPQTDESMLWTYSGVSSSAQRTANGVRLDTELSGAHTLIIDGGPVLAWLAVNTDRTESDVIVPSPILDVAAEIAPEAFSRREEGAPWLVLLALFLGLIQALLSFPKQETV